ncbi:MAG: hypothetical protein RLZZ381_3892 [Cyanobacteriota bacterium]|jgi:hypothetical protein
MAAILYLNKFTNECHWEIPYHYLLRSDNSFNILDRLSIY